MITAGALRLRTQDRKWELHRAALSPPPDAGNLYRDTPRPQMWAEGDNNNSQPK
jgi:hypothetical protein